MGDFTHNGIFKQHNNIVDLDEMIKKCAALADEIPQLKTEITELSMVVFNFPLFYITLCNE